MPRLSSVASRPPVSLAIAAMRSLTVETTAEAFSAIPMECSHQPISQLTQWQHTACISSTRCDVPDPIRLGPCPMISRDDHVSSFLGEKFWIYRAESCRMLPRNRPPSRASEPIITFAFGQAPLRMGVGSRRPPGTCRVAAQLYRKPSSFLSDGHIPR